MKPLLSLAFLLRRSLSKYLLNVQYARDCPEHILNLYSHCMRRLPLFQLRNDGFGEVGCLVQGAWTLFTVSRAEAAFPPPCVSCSYPVTERGGETDSPRPLSSRGLASGAKKKCSNV